MVGTIIGTYRLEEWLGDGGLGSVYRAVDGASGREAAFRVFAREVSADAMLADRLRAMAPVLKRLQHPNIAAFFELVNAGADLALFLEYVPGASLDKVRQPAGHLDINVSVSCAVQVLRALEYAHAAGVLHHALRPTNVMVTRQGTVKVLDFGIGHAFGANRKTREDRLLSVLAYLAPEQIQNQPGDARSDIYAVGVMLYELLTGRLPFAQRTEFALRQAHLAEPPAAPRSLVPGLPEWLDQAVLRALAKNPASRYQNATEFRAVLEAALGLSTSREAAIVRQRNGVSAETFAAAPPIPAPLPAGPGATAVGHDRQATEMPPSRPAGIETDETVVARTAGRSVLSAAAPRAWGPAMAAGLAFLVILLVGAGAYLWMRSTSPPLSPGVPQGDQQVPAAGAEITPSNAPPAPAPAPPESVTPQAPPSAASASPTPEPAATTPPAIKKTPLRSAASQKAAVPSAPVAAPSAPSAPPAAPAATGALPSPPRVDKAPDVSYRKVKLITQAGSSEKSTDVVLLFSDDRLSVTPAEGGAALRTVRYDDITGASYSKAQKRRLGFIKSAQHLLEIDTAGEPLLLRLDSGSVDPILADLQARSGKAVSR